MSRRLTRLALLAFLLILAVGGVTRVHASVHPHTTHCATMAMAAVHAPAPIHQENSAGGCDTCGIDCPMHCAAIGRLPVSASISQVGRTAYPASLCAHIAGWSPHAEHGPTQNARLTETRP